MGAMDVRERGYVVAGSPDSVVQQLTEMEQTLRVGHVMVLLHFGDMPKDVVQYNTTRFAQDVMPRLRPMWSEWEDNWWVRPAAGSAQAPAASLNGAHASPSASSASSAQREVSVATSD